MFHEPPLIFSPTGEDGVDKHEDVRVDACVARYEARTKPFAGGGGEKGRERGGHSLFQQPFDNHVVRPHICNM